MHNNSINNTQKKSLKERFLRIIGMLFFLLYLTFGLAIIFWKGLPLNMPNNYRMAFGILVIVYSFFRFIRFFQKSES